MSDWTQEPSDDDKIDAAESWMELRERNARLVAALEALEQVLADEDDIEYGYTMRRGMLKTVREALSQ